MSKRRWSISTQEGCESFGFSSPIKNQDGGTSLAVQWLGLHISTAGSTIPGRELRSCVPAARPKKKESGWRQYWYVQYIPILNPKWKLLFQETGGCVSHFHSMSYQVCPWPCVRQVSRFQSLSKLLALGKLTETGFLPNIIILMRKGSRPYRYNSKWHK